MRPRTAAPTRVAGLDAIRFVAASWVVLSHFGLWPFLVELHPASPVFQVLKGAAGAVINGPAAVIVFFVVSGYCIHFPYARGAAFDAGAFVARRLIRIGIPLFAAVLLSAAVGVSFGTYHQAVLWSLFCELLYYAAYPLLRRATRIVSLRMLIGISFVAAAVVILGNADHASRSSLNPTAGDYPAFGLLGNAVLGLPCWLLGLQLAEWHSPTQRIAASGIWMWRVGVWALSAVLLMLRFHSPIGYPWTLDLFAIVVMFWLRQEIVHYRDAPPWAWLERAGSWSYSLYLVHPLAKPLFLAATAPGSLSVIRWAACIVAIYFASYVFHLLVERPAHSFARKIGRLVTRSAESAVA